MTNILDFIRWALTHVNPNTVPSGAVLANGTATNVGAEPWHYLYGTVRTKTTQSRIAERCLQMALQPTLEQSRGTICMALCGQKPLHPALRSGGKTTIVPTAGRKNHTTTPPRECNPMIMPRIVKDCSMRT